MTNENRSLVGNQVSASVEQLLVSLIIERADAVEQLSRVSESIVQTSHAANEITNQSTQLLNSPSNSTRERTESLNQTFSSGSIFDGLLLSPIIRGLVGLFSGTGEEPIAKWTKYSFPREISSSLSANVNMDGSLSSTTYDSYGISRSPSESQPTINMTIHAMDAKSIVERSDDIALALKRALLSNSSIQDNIGEI